MPFALHGLDDAIAQHEELVQRARDLTPFLEAKRVELEEMIDRAWAARISPGGDRWAPTKRASEADGELRRSVRLRVEGTSIVIEVTAEHASWQFFGTSRIPARNPLPVEPRGGALEWMERGEAAVWLERMQADLVAYLTDSEAA